jgi:hypothetical protein
MYVFILQFEGIKYTTNQTHKLLSISNNCLHGGKQGLISCCWPLLEAWNIVHMNGNLT